MRSLMHLLCFLPLTAHAVCPNWPPKEYPIAAGTVPPSKKAAQCDVVVYATLLEMSQGPRSSCIQDRRLQVLRVLKGEPTDPLIVSEKDGCVWGCPPLLSGSQAWLAFLRKTPPSSPGAAITYSLCGPAIVSIPQDDLEDLDAQYAWDSKARALGFHNLRFVLGDDGTEDRENFTNFPKKHLLPLLTANLQKLADCGLQQLIPDDPGSGMGWLTITMMPGRGKETDTKVEFSPSAPKAKLKCVRDLFTSLTYPPPLPGKETAFHMKFRVSSSGSAVDSAAAIQPKGYTISGGLPNEEILPVLRRHYGMFDECGMRRQFPNSTYFQVRLSWKSDASGKVTGAKAQLPSDFAPGSKNALTCLERKLAAIRFPTSLTGDIAAIQYHFSMRGASDKLDTASLYKAKKAESERLMLLATQKRKAGKFSQADELLENACELGNTSSCQTLAEVAEARADNEKAIKWHERACIAGGGDSCTKSLIGGLDPKATAEANRWWKIAQGAINGNLPASDKDYDTAHEAFKKACILGHVGACENAAQHAKNFNRESDTAKYYRIACEAGHGNSCNRLEDGLGKNDHAAKRKLWEDVCGNGKAPEACYRLGVVANDEGDMKTARQWLTRHCKSTDKGHGCARLGKLEKKQGNTHQGAKHFHTACLRGDLDTGCKEFLALKNPVTTLDKLARYAGNKCVTDRFAGWCELAVRCEEKLERQAKAIRWRAIACSRGASHGFCDEKRVPASITSKAKR